MQEKPFAATCIIDARVSTDKQLQGNGLENQLSVCRHHAQLHNWKIQQEYTKAFSGQSEEREDFKRILADIKRFKREGQPVDYYLFMNIDRFTRLGDDGYLKMKAEVIKLGVQPIDARGIIQPEKNTLAHLGVSYGWSWYSPNETSELQEAVQGKINARETLSRMIGTEIMLAREGFHVHGRVDGYRNVKVATGGKIRPALDIEPERAKFYAEIFRLRAKNEHSDKEIVDRVNAMGFLSLPRNRWARTEDGEKKIVGIIAGKPLSVKQLQKIIQRPIYAGVRYEKWNNDHPTWAKLADDAKPIVDVATFNAASRGKVYIKVNGDGQPEVLFNYDEKERELRRRLKFHPDYRYDKMVVCHVCRKPLKNSGKGNRGRHGGYFQAYHCDRSEACCKRTGRIPKERYETAITKFLDSLVFEPEFANRLEEKLLKNYRLQTKKLVLQSADIGKFVSRMKEEQANKLDSLDATQSVVVRRKIEEQIEALERKINAADEQRSKVDVEERDVKSFVREIQNTISKPVDVLGLNNDPYMQRRFFEMVFDRLPSWTEINNRTPKLSKIFELSEAFKQSKSVDVNIAGLGWNTFETIILQWNAVFEENTKIRKLKSQDRTRNCANNRTPL